jgi:hypothetical protein
MDKIEKSGLFDFLSNLDFNELRNIYFVVIDKYSITKNSLINILLLI